VRTTDLARVDADGFLWILGRSDQTILRGGYKVQPEVVRAALERDPAVVEAAVVGVPDARLGAVPVAAIERGPDTRSTRRPCWRRQALARYEVPVAITVVDALPRTASGKADLAAVRAMFDGEAVTVGR
jgi:acyl-coenzyme A synthetase/AMP-(fatty) acid ligase